MTKREVLETWFQKVWTEKNTATIYEMFVPLTQPEKAFGLKEEQGIGPKEFEDFQQLLLALIDNIHVEISSSVENGNIIMAECTFRVQNKNSIAKEEILMRGCVVGEIIDEKIVSAQNYFDFLHLFEKLGLLPENTFLKCLTGNKACG